MLTYEEAFHIVHSIVESLSTLIKCKPECSNLASPFLKANHFRSIDLKANTHPSAHNEGDLPKFIKFLSKIESFLFKTRLQICKDRHNILSIFNIFE